MYRNDKDCPTSRKIVPPHGLDHNLTGYFSDLRRLNATKALADSPLYRQIRPEVNRLLNSVVKVDLSDRPPPAGPAVRATAWNIERGHRLEGILDVLQNHPRVRGSDLLLFTELDHGMARTQNRFIAHEIARAMDLNFVFGPGYINLEKGSGLEARTQGENTLALHGNAVFSPYPLHDPHLIPLPNGKDKMRGREKRLGCQQAVAATVDHPLGPFRAVSLHLDAHSTQQHRRRQMALVLKYLDTLTPRLPVVIGGDWNTSTYNSKRAVYAILGFWRRVIMGVDYTIRNHYLHPDRWFERGLFRELERCGYRYRDLNEPGGCTFHYDVQDVMANSGLADWVPQWCFWFINWSLKNHNGRCPLKLDWFAGRGILPAPDPPPCVVQDIRQTHGKLSDHQPIVLDFILD